nr:MAG TPA: hypothetical protein [Caudoviricetes sp.]
MALPLFLCTKLLPLTSYSKIFTIFANNYITLIKRFISRTKWGLTKNENRLA